MKGLAGLVPVHLPCRTGTSVSCRADRGEATCWTRGKKAGQDRALHPQTYQQGFRSTRYHHLRVAAKTLGRWAGTLHSPSLHSGFTAGTDQCMEEGAPSRHRHHLPGANTMYCCLKFGPQGQSSPPKHIPNPPTAEFVQFACILDSLGGGKMEELEVYSPPK